MGNNGRNAAKAQITSRENEKDSLRVEPKLVVLKWGIAGEFQVFITPHCSCKTEETMGVVSVDLLRGKENNGRFENNVRMEQTSLLYFAVT